MVDISPVWQIPKGIAAYLDKKGFRKDPILPDITFTSDGPFALMYGYEIPVEFVQDPKPRPSWDEYFLAMAETAAKRADCRRRRVGVIVTQNNRIVGHGYNGTAPGAPGCLEGACPRGLKSYDEKPPLSDYSDCISRHGEVNALWNTAAGERAGSTVYVTDEPCAQCRTVMQSMGVARVVWPEGELNW